MTRISTQLKLTDYTYDLPEDRIAEFPLEKRDTSKLLVYRKGKIEHRNFSELDSQIPGNSSLFFNNTKVLPARLIFHKATGARIEIFLLEPVAPSRDVAKAMTTQQPCTWKCMIGNLKKWKGEQLMLELPAGNRSFQLEVDLADRNDGLVRFQWSAGIAFSDVVHLAGKIPLPPYIRRDAEESDYKRYQTVYARLDGAVAAPTAGLHFTEGLLGKLREKGIEINELTLHVSAGTFQPVKVENVKEHPMHSEEIVVTRENVEALLRAEKRIAVGTTSMRTMESLYWYGTKLVQEQNVSFLVGQNDPYTLVPVPFKQSMEAVLGEMNHQKRNYLTGRTEIFIYPGYTFRVCEGLITNYHLPGSTLILLVAAFVGDDWRTIYKKAVENGYRFLSYGDSSLLLP